jgi:DNA primase
LAVILDALRQLGLKQITVNPDKKWVRCCCPFHDDEHPSFSISLISGAWTCFSRCGSGSWSEFLIRFGKEGDGKFPMIGLNPQWNAPVIYLEEKRMGDFELPVIDKNAMTKTFQDRGFTFEMLKPFDIGLDHDRGCMAIPVYDVNHKAVGCVWRQPPHMLPRYLNSPGMNMHELVYGLYKIPDMVNELWFLEGPLNAVWVTASGKFAVSFFGSNISMAQQQAVLSKHPQRVVLAFDNDVAGIKATAKVGRMLAGRISTDVLTFPPDINDVQQMKIEDLKNQPTRSFTEWAFKD